MKRLNRISKRMKLAETNFITFEEIVDAPYGSISSPSSNPAYITINDYFTLYKNTSKSWVKDNVAEIGMPQTLSNEEAYNYLIDVYNKDSKIECWQIANNQTFNK